MTVLDTNVLVGITVDALPQANMARNAVDLAAAAGPLAVTRQILREFMAVMSRRQYWLDDPSVAAASQIALGFTRRFVVLEDGPDVWAHLVDLANRFRFGGKQVHDANIVATMLAHGDIRLLTFNGADFRRFAPLIEIVEP